MNATYTMEGDKVRVTRQNGTTYALSGKHLNYCITTATRLMNQCPNRTLAATLEEMVAAMDVLVNAKYATDTNTAWAAMGVKGGAL